MAERWESMTDEERERFRQGMRGHWRRGDRKSGDEVPPQRA